MSILEHHGSFARGEATHPSLPPFALATVVKVAVGAAALSFLAYLVAAGHPFVAAWSAGLMLAWLFLAGAAMASRD